MLLPLVLALSLGLVHHGAVADTDNVVSLLSSNSGTVGYNQVVTSSTLRWVKSSGGGAPVNAVIGAVRQNNDDEEDVETPIWVCRARADGMWVSGSLTSSNERDGGQCVVSLHGFVKPHSTYEVLQNVEDGAKLNWVRWDKFNLVGSGTVTSGDSESTYIARRKSTNPEATATYSLGKLDLSVGLMGKIFVVEDGVEKEYQDGEVLVETEPIRYEMDRVKINLYRTKYQREAVTLGMTTLRNEDEPNDDGTEGEISRVDTVIAYGHNRTVSWGHGHAILTGLPVSVRMANGTDLEDFKWATDAFATFESTYQVETFLAPGRGVNVTLVGNWTESNSPFSATVTAIYADGTKKARTIEGNRREVGIRDVRPEFGPVYYLHNNSHVPTTTTTTTTTTTVKTTTTSVTTSRTTSTSTAEPKPIPASPMEEMNSTTKKGDIAEIAKKRENQSMLSDGPKTEQSNQGSGGNMVRPGAVLGLLVAVWWLT